MAGVVAERRRTTRASVVRAAFFILGGGRVERASGSECVVWMWNVRGSVDQSTGVGRTNDSSSRIGLISRTGWWVDRLSVCANRTRFSRSQGGVRGSTWWPGARSIRVDSLQSRGRKSARAWSSRLEWFSPRSNRFKGDSKGPAKWLQPRVSPPRASLLRSGESRWSEPLGAERSSCCLRSEPTRERGAHINPFSGLLGPPC